LRLTCDHRITPAQASECACNGNFELSTLLAEQYFDRSRT
jgi:hypothetical protein